MSREFLLRGINDSVVQAYYEYMVDMAVIFGANITRAKEELLDVLEFESSLANVCKKNKNKKEYFYFILPMIYSLFPFFHLQTDFNGNGTTS